MSEDTASRPKLVQEGRPLNQHQPSSLSLAGGSSKPKYRLVVGGEDENEPLPDDPDQHYSQQYSSNYYRGGGGGRGYYHSRGYHRGGGRRYNRGYNRGYGGYRGGIRRRIIKNPKAPGLIDSRIVIGGGDVEASEDYPDQNIDEEKHHHRIQSTVDVEHIIPQTYNLDLHCLESMEGTVKLEDKTPLIIMDGANVAHAFADIATGKTRGEPDYYGLVVAANYFLAAGKRVLIVLPAPWFRVKAPQVPEKTDDGKVDEEAERKVMLANDKIEILKDLKDQGLLVASPPREDDDCFPVTISNKERLRAAKAGEGGSYVLSNDFFRHATGRDIEIDQWLNHEWGRISFAFCDLGTKDEDGNRELDFIPNPRHPMVAEIERNRHSG